MNPDFLFDLARQASFVAAMKPAIMNQDMPVPIDLMRKYKEDEDVWHFATFLADLGCGNGLKTAQILRELEMGGLAVDISPGMVTLAQKNFLMALCGDLTNRTFVDSLTVDGHFGEVYGTVNMEGLLVNVPGGRTQVLSTADRFVTPGGYLFVTEVMQCDEYNPAFMREMCKDKKTGEKKYHLYREAWARRYRANAEIGLPYGTIVIAKPGPEKGKEWGSPEDLLAILATAGEPDGTYERTCEHQSLDKLCDSLEVGLHYEVKEIRYGTIPSRVPGQRYPIAVVVARKPPYFRYFPGLIGEHRSRWMTKSSEDVYGAR